MNSAIEFQECDIQNWHAILDEMPIDPPPRYIAEYIENNRIMPTNTPFPGPWKNWRTQFAVEIMDCMSPFNPTQHVDLMSASQVVKTSVIENVIGFYIGAVPSPILFMSGTDALLEKWASKRLEPMIDSLNLRQKFRAPIETNSSRGTGDKAKQKLFNGGFLEMASAQSASSQRADSIRILCLDEVSAAPPLLTTGEGYWDENAEARTKAWGSRRKILSCSTPTEHNTCTMYRRFLLGDQCEYMVPCPICGKMQILAREHEDGNHGLKTDTKAGEIIQVYYLCEFCKNAIFEHQKNVMIRGGKWIAMARPERLRRSFHLNSLLAPFGGYSWMDYMSDLMKAERTPDGMRTFTNHQDGRPYVAAGTRPKAEKIIENRGDYKAGIVPDGVLYLTIGADVQRGSANDPENPPRIELEVLGIGAGYRTWSIQYKRFEGKIDDPYAGAWELLHEWAIETGLTFVRGIDGFKFPVSLVFIDSGDGELTDIVYEFSKRWINTFPIKGQRAIARKKGEKPDELTDNSFRRYKYSKLSEDTGIYIISTVWYKNQLYNNLKVKREEHGPQKPGFCNFPYDYPEKYFDMLTAEEKVTEGGVTYYAAHGRRNESLDCRVYSLCAADVFLDNELLNYRAWAKQQGWKQHEIQQITHRTVIENMIESTKLKNKS